MKEKYITDIMGVTAIEDTLPKRKMLFNSKNKGRLSKRKVRELDNNKLRLVYRQLIDDEYIEKGITFNKTKNNKYIFKIDEMLDLYNHITQASIIKEADALDNDNVYIHIKEHRTNTEHYIHAKKQGEMK